jgi:hypothetical protein
MTITHRRPSFKRDELQAILDRTGGVCHVCGQLHKLDRYGKEWEVDHVLSIAGGGKDNPENYLAACEICNGLKWMHNPDAARTIMALGTAARSEAYKRRSKLGAAIREMRARRLADNWARHADTRRRFPDSHTRGEEARKLRESYVAVENRAIELLKARSAQPKFGWRDALALVLSASDARLTDNIAGYRILADLEGRVPASE